MIIDMHTHMFPDRIAVRAVSSLAEGSNLRPHTRGTAESLLSSMEEAGIARSVVLPVATKPGQVEHINSGAAALNTAFPGRLFSLGTMHPDCPEPEKELARICSLGLKGFKVHPVFHHTNLDDIRYLRIFDAAASLGLFAVTHTGIDIGFPGEDRASPAMAAHVLASVGSFPLVCAHMGGWGQWEEAVWFLAGTGALIDTAFSFGIPESLHGWQEGPPRMLDREAFLSVVSAFGPDRVLFGSDSPWASQRESADWVRALPLSSPDLEKILSGNALRLLGGLPG